MRGQDQLPRIVETSPSDIKAHIVRIYNLVRDTGAKRIVEVGVRSGDSTRAFLAAAHDFGCQLLSYDQAGDAYRVREVTERHGIEWLGQHWWCLRSDSVAAANHHDDKTLDIVFIDTDHTYELTKKEIAAWSPKVKHLGVMAFHDTDLRDSPRDGVLPAMHEFQAANPNWRIELFHNCCPGDCGFGLLWKP